MSRVRKIYLDKACEVFCVVDEEDYAFLLKWKWSYTWDRSKTKRYATRMTRSRKEHSRQIKIYMHKVILDRTDKKQPSEAHTIGDHDDGDSLNNRRANLDWATPSMNRRTARARTRKAA